MVQVSRPPLRAANRKSARAFTLLATAIVAVSSSVSAAPVGQFSNMIQTASNGVVNQWSAPAAFLKNIVFTHPAPYVLPRPFVGDDSVTQPQQPVAPEVKPVSRSSAAVQTASIGAKPMELRSRLPLLGSRGKETYFTPVTSRWNRVQDEAKTAIEAVGSCKDHPEVCEAAKLGAWAEVVDSAKNMRKGHRITYVNRAINGMLAYRDDRLVWKTAEYWASPSESLKKQAGDCEDFAILKYWTLRELGFDDQDMRIVVLRDRAAKTYHAVLAVYFNEDWLILDNRFSRVRLQRDLPNYQPLYALNAETQWSYGNDVAQPVRLAARLKDRVAE